MPTIHCMSNSDVSEVDIRTAVGASMFTYIFVNRDNWNKRRHIEAKNDISAQNIVGSDYIFAARFRWRCDMAHEIKLETVTNKAAQLNALLFTISGEFTGNPITDNLIELAHELSDSVACWLIEENAQRKES